MAMLISPKLTSYAIAEISSAAEPARAKPNVDSRQSTTTIHVVGTKTLYSPQPSATALNL
jgi:hypothetical protein